MSTEINDCKCHRSSITDERLCEYVPFRFKALIPDFCVNRVFVPSSAAVEIGCARSAEVSQIQRWNTTLMTIHPVRRTKVRLQ